MKTAPRVLIEAGERAGRSFRRHADRDLRQHRHRSRGSARRADTACGVPRATQRERKRILTALAPSLRSHPWRHRRRDPPVRASCRDPSLYFHPDQTRTREWRHTTRHRERSGTDPGTRTHWSPQRYLGTLIGTARRAARALGAIVWIAVQPTRRSTRWGAEAPGDLMVPAIHDAMRISARRGATSSVDTGSRARGGLPIGFSAGAAIAAAAPSRASWRGWWLRSCGRAERTWRSLCGTRSLCSERAVQRINSTCVARTRRGCGCCSSEQRERAVERVIEFATRARTRPHLRSRRAVLSAELERVPRAHVLCFSIPTRSSRATSRLPSSTRGRSIPT